MTMNKTKKITKVDQQLAKAIEDMLEMFEKADGGELALRWFYDDDKIKRAKALRSAYKKKYKQLLPLLHTGIDRG